MALETTLKLLFITSLCLIASISAHVFPGFHEHPRQPSHINERTSAKASFDANLKKICDNTDHPDHCLSSISPFVKGKPTVDNSLDASIRAATNFAKYAIDQVKILAKKSPPDMSSTYKDCIDFYENALEGFGETLEAHPARDVGAMQSQLSGVITWLSTCEDEFSESGGVSPLKGFADKLTSMTSDSLAIVQQMH